MATSSLRGAGSRGVVFVMKLVLASMIVAPAALATITPNGAQVWDGNGWLTLSDNTDAPKPYPPKSDSWKDPETTIYVGISSFRDKRCPRTLYNLFTKAEHPNRLTISVVQQNDKSDDDCLEGYCKLMGAKGEGPSCPRASQVKMVRVDYKLAAGPCWGRHFQSYELRDEEFCMQLDSHMDFMPKWDSTLTEMWAQAENEYGVLTTYVHRIEQLGTLDDRGEVPHLCQVYFTEGERNPRYVQAKLALRLPRPKLTNTWAAGFSFAKCHAWKAVPYDPNLRMVFDGEEFTTATRLWTRGYDMYTPHKSIVGHDYNGVKEGAGPAPSSWLNNKGAAEQRAIAYKRLKSLLGMPGGDTSDEMAMSIGKFGVGYKRSMEQYQKFVGINLATLEHLGNRCGDLEWIPFEESWPPTENNLSGPYWERVIKAQRGEGQYARLATEEPFASAQMVFTAGGRQDPGGHSAVVTAIAVLGGLMLAFVCMYHFLVAHDAKRVALAPAPVSRHVHHEPVGYNSVA